ncbi:hypothetical protein F4808DRAFT_418382 [Astrocystis sublimbata]|nr:hypothetical protein F4808DRAFT_418382 [Astrocystis sublimbata]
MRCSGRRVRSLVLWLAGRESGSALISYLRYCTISLVSGSIRSCRYTRVVKHGGRRFHDSPLVQRCGGCEGLGRRT